MQPQQPATPASQHSGVGGQVLPPALQAAALADAIAAAAGSSSPMAKSVRAAASLPQSPMRSPVRYSPESQRQRQRFYHLPPQSPSAATAAPPSPGQAAAGAALFAAAAAAAAASPVQAPQSVPPSPAQYSPESLRCRQDLHHQQQLAPVRVPPASAVLAAEQAALAAEQRVVAQVAQATSGRHSPGSRWQRQAAAAQQAALAQAQLRRLLSEQQQEMQAAAAEAEAEAEGLQAQAPAPTPTSRFVSAVPAEQQQQRFATATTPGTGVGSAGFLQTPLPPQHSAACAAMMISARLAQAEQVRAALLWPTASPPCPLPRLPTPPNSAPPPLNTAHPDRCHSGTAQLHCSDGAPTRGCCRQRAGRRVVGATAADAEHSGPARGTVQVRQRRCCWPFPSPRHAG